MEEPKVEAQTSVSQKSSFLSRLRPREWRKKAPVPLERGVNPEYTAGFLSLLTFQWINPLMMVCWYLRFLTSLLILGRSDTNGP